MLKKKQGLFSGTGYFADSYIDPSAFLQYSRHGASLCGQCGRELEHRTHVMLKHLLPCRPAYVVQLISEQSLDLPQECAPTYVYQRSTALPDLSLASVTCHWELWEETLCCAGVCPCHQQKEKDYNLKLSGSAATWEIEIQEAKVVREHSPLRLLLLFLHAHIAIFFSPCTYLGELFCTV